MPSPLLNHVPCAGPAGPHRMAYWSWGRADAPHLVVCVHGLTRQGRDFDVLAQALVERSPTPLRVVCPDVAGRGESDWLADPAHYQVPVYVGDMLALLARLQAQAPIATLDWVGTSMGGLIGMGLFGTPDLPLPAPLHRLVLNDIGPAVEWAAIQRMQQYVGRAPTFASVEEACEALWRVASGFGPHTPAEWRALTEPMLRPLPGGGWRLHYDPAIGENVRAATEASGREGEALLWQAYDRIRARTLLLRGADSDLLTPATARAMTERGPRARLIEFQGVGHAPTLVTLQQVEAVASFLLGGAVPDENPDG
ncbi:alpha/beta fold hydrolase [Ramlibacter sp. MAHUQ-53]|uniref:alpha/beta fold hydrolase n=1 Tax=unclassified Ramlibacter TaxID=2617605 RepID=UPI003626D61E